MTANETTLEANDSLLKVYLRLRKTSAASDAYTLAEDDPMCLVATAPDNTETHKNARRNHLLSVQKFKFSRIFLPATSQSDLFESTALPLLEECLNFENNALLFTYGVTNSGKTHTVQGPRNDAGLLPRSLDLIFNTLGSCIKPRSIYCPHLHNDVCKMTDKLQASRESLKHRIIYPDNLSQDLEISGMTDTNSIQCTIGSVENASYQITDNVMVQLTNEQDVEYSVWISYLELYNENIYDLLQAPPEAGEIKPKDRPTLRLGEDHNMSSYVKGATHLEVTSFAEASRALLYGQRNRKKAATSMNQNSSRSHAIFKISIIGTNTASHQSRCTQISFVDLAGSERYGKTQAAGLRLKEAGNINTSLLTLGKCIASLRHNSRIRGKQGGAQIVPYRESKLTKLFKNFLSGEGRLSMIVCVNPSTECFDESIHALKFSALASEALLIPRPVSASHEESSNNVDIELLKYNIREEVMEEVQDRIRKLRQDHKENIERTKQRERDFQEGMEKDLQEYYSFVIEELKEKVREARKKNGDNTELEESLATVRAELQRTREELRECKSEYGEFRTDTEQRLFHSKLELRTTQQLYTDCVEEKDRCVKELAEKEGEIRSLFQDVEEATRLSTFWEKECNDIKTDRAQQVEKHQSTIQQMEVRCQQGEAELRQKVAIIEQMTKEKLEQNDIGSQHAEEVSRAQLEVEKVRGELETVQGEFMNAKEALASAKESLAIAEKALTAKDAEIREHKGNVEEMAGMISQLKSELTGLQKVLSSQGDANKENEDAASLRERLTHAQTQVLEKNKVIEELQEELSDLVRNKSLQFDTLMTSKERECEELQEQLTREREVHREMKKRLEQLEEMIEQREARIAQLEESGNTTDKENTVENTKDSSQLEAIQREQAEVEGRLEEVRRERAEVERELEEQKRGRVEAERGLEEGRKERDELLQRLEEGQKEVAELKKKMKELRDELQEARESSAKPVAAGTAAVALELARQEADRTKVELATAQRRHAEQLKQLRDTADAKDVQLQTWYEEKEKAVALITRKKDSEIDALEKKLEEVEKRVEEQSRKLETAAANTEGVEGSEEYQRLTAESTRKLTEMADMVITIETERDDLQTEYDAFRSKIEAAISEKEVTFKELRADLQATREANTELSARIKVVEARAETAESRYSELERTTAVEGNNGRKRAKAISEESAESELNTTQSRWNLRPRDKADRQSARGSVSNSTTRPSTNTGRVSVKTSASTSRRSSLANRKSSAVRPKRACASRGLPNRRTSQILLNKALNQGGGGRPAKRSRAASRRSEDSAPSDSFTTPEPSGVKRKATLKGLKDYISSHSPLIKKGKTSVALAEVSESDSDFATPTATAASAAARPSTRGKRKLHKSQISTPELLTLPDRPGLKDVTPDSEVKNTRSRTRLIQQHLSGGASLRKTRSRATKQTKI